MREAKVYFKGEEAGQLTQHDDGSFTFRYNEQWKVDNSKPSIGLTLPKENETFHSGYLFPFFFNMLPEGMNKQVVCKHMRIDENDHFGLLLSTTHHDTIGAVTVRKIQKTV